MGEEIMGKGLGLQPPQTLNPVLAPAQKSKMVAANGGYFFFNFKKLITQFVCTIAA